MCVCMTGRRVLGVDLSGEGEGEGSCLLTGAVQIGAAGALASPSVTVPRGLAWSPTASGSLTSVAGPPPSAVLLSLAVVSVPMVTAGPSLSLVGLWWLLHIAWYQMFWDPAMAETTHRRRISAAYLCPIFRAERTRSLPGNQLPRLPTMKG